mgnify:CR=1 FL=1|jgi:hypothetical protein|eukprot:5320051-Pyramimonas_sp.AAC.1
MDNYSHIPYVITFEQAVNEIANEVNNHPAFKSIHLQLIKNKSATLLKKNNIDVTQFSLIGWVTYRNDLVKSVSQDIMSNILDHLSKRNGFNQQIV